MGGLNATAAVLPFMLTYGFIVFGGTGAAAAQLGLSAAVLSVVLGSVAMQMLSGSQMPTPAPSASTALVLGTLVLGLANDSVLRPDHAAGIAWLLACTGITVVAAGLLLVLLGLMRAGQLVRYVPQPVLAGFMNAVALLIVWSQAPAFLGVPATAWSHAGLSALAQLQPLTLALAAATTVLAIVLAWRWPAAPAPLLALVLATAGVMALHSAAPGVNQDLARVGELTVHLPRPDALTPWLGPDALAVARRQGGAMATTALLLALIGALESLLNIAAVDPLLDQRSDPDRELRALGGANVVVGLFGGLFLVYMRLRAVSTLDGGGRGPRAVLVGSGLMALVFTLGLPWVSQVPMAVVAGIVVMLAGTLVDRWSRQLVWQWWQGARSRELMASLLVVGLVCLVTLGFGFVAGVLVGVLLSMLIFMRALNRSLVRLRYRASEIPSRRIYPVAIEQALQAARLRIEVFELEGALFFGNAHRLAAEVERAVQACAALVHVVVDLRRVNTIDASGTVMLAQLGQRLARQGRQLHLAGVVADNRCDLALRAQGAAPGKSSAWHSHPDADRAIEAAEQSLLAAVGRPMDMLRLAPERCELFEGLDDGQAAHLLALMPSQRLRAGEQLFAQEAPGDAIYLLTEGSISIVDATRTQRYLSLSPGMCFGETAVLDGRGRTAAAVADIDSTVHRLAAADLTDLQRLHPATAAQVYLNLARHLSRRLRNAAAAWQRAAS